MTNKIIEYVNRFVQLSEEDGKELMLLFKMVKIKKRQFIVQPNFIATNRYYVLVRCFQVLCCRQLRGMTHTTIFAIEDWWIYRPTTAIFYRNLQPCLYACARRQYNFRNLQ